MTAHGRVETVQASSCLPNSGHSAASGNALAIQIGWPSRPAGCGRLPTDAILRPPAAYRHVAAGQAKKVTCVAE